MLSEETVIRVCDRYQSGESVAAISASSGVPRPTVYWWLNRRGVSRRGHGIGRKLYACNHAFFRDISDERSAYWLGFLAADGCITNGCEVGLTLSVKDRDHTERFKECIESDHPIHEYRNPRRVSLRISSPEMVADLIRHGVTPTKTFTLRFPDLPQDLLSHFVRGYVDGDGCFGFYPPSAYRFSVVGNVPFLQDLQSFLIARCDLAETKLDYANKDNTIAAIRYKGRRQVARIADLLYQTATVCLPRKRDIALLATQQ